MKTVKLEINLTYHDQLMRGPDEEREWFLNQMLTDHGSLTLYSRTIEGFVGDVKVVRIIDAHEAFSELKSESIDDD
ncbi:hypothetical protein [Candidatus Macondimonas diazotrophica]|uniref:Uncharacterized protein n=1 Tax=Candidatus Macondimonas diazotrophica TaxID=2305248 RepID=A0A4Z0F4A5_9GAMM|nr:hypothetical protein [Candidatus Macondimonas diazotrophica]TFZ80913.1 hypothetical protein E4680_13680 [Candidatus Macondimonas diazotrophica]